MIRWVFIVLIITLGTESAFSGAALIHTCKDLVQESPNMMTKMINSSITDIVCESLPCDSTNEKIVSEYTGLINPGSYKDTAQVGYTNAGLTGFFKVQMQKRGSCYAELAQNFYNDNNLFARNLSAQYIGSDRQEKGKTVWDSALKFSKGDPNLAVNLIGICGHDNNGQNYDRERTFYPCLKDSDDAEKWECPSMNTYFYQQDGLPIQEKDRNDLENLNRDLPLVYEKSPGEVPHKSYHIYGATYLTCKLIQSGMAPEKAAAVERTTSLMYRAIRICRASLKNLENYNNLLRKLKVKPADPNDREAWLSQFRKEAPRIVNLIKTQSTKNDELLKNIGLVPMPKNFLDDKKIPKDIVDKKIQAYPGIILAGFLSTYSEKTTLTDEQKQSALKTYYGEGSDFLFKVIEKTKQKSNSTAMSFAEKIGTGIASDSLAFKTARCVGDSLYNYASNNHQTCKNLPQCEVANKKLKTYAADYRQSDLTHKAGVNFAKQHCSAMDNSSVEQKACIALEKKSNAGADETKAQSTTK